MNIGAFLSNITSAPMASLFFVLILGVIFVNGWTDAPNAISSCVATRAMTPKKAVFMSAIFNFLGVSVMTFINSNVAITLLNMVNFKGDARIAMTALSAGMTAIILWATLAWFFGIPTSESHALIAGLSGAAVALQKSFSGINIGEWIKVIYGLLLSTVLGFVLGYSFTKITESICKNMDRQRTTAFFNKAQIFGGAAMSFMHGAQDGQKFMGVIMLGLILQNGNYGLQNAVIPFPVLLVSSFTMALGTSLGGYKIIKTVGLDMVKQEKHQGFAADLSGTLCLLASTLFGLPVSTTHVKTTAIVGAGTARRPSSVNYGKLKEMALTWILTFPGCGLIGYFTAKLFIFLFA